MRLFDDIPFLKWTGPKKPFVPRVAGDIFKAALPERSACDPLIGKHRHLCHSPLVGAFGEGYFGQTR